MVNTAPSSTPTHSPLQPLEKPRNRTLTSIATLTLALAVCGPALGDATKDDAMAMVKKGIAFIKTNGVEKGYA